MKYTYIIGANCQLDVTARILPAEPELSIGASAEILEVTCNGQYFETDDIYIKNNQGTFESLDSLLEIEAFEVNTHEY